MEILNAGNDSSTNQEKTEVKSENNLLNNNSDTSLPEEQNNITDSSSQDDVVESVSEKDAESSLDNVSKGNMEATDNNENAKTEHPDSSSDQSKAETKTPDLELNKESSESKETETHWKDENHFIPKNLSELVSALEKIINQNVEKLDTRRFHQLREIVFKKISEDTETEKANYISEGNPVELFQFIHPIQKKLNGILQIFRQKQEELQKLIEKQQADNLKERESIIERLKNLYTNSDTATNYFKEIREIKLAWANAGQIPKADFKLVNNNYFHHLTQFYAMLDLNKEYMQQEHEHNLETRRHIISRAKELLTESSVHQALNELQYLHKLWREDAEPVAEEFRESTWLELKEISNKIHERKTELFENIEAEQKINLEKKNKIIESIKAKISSEIKPNHKYWLTSIKEIEELRAEFLKIGGVPRKLANQNWQEFKDVLKQFNHTKNDYYKKQKEEQHLNLDKKRQLIKTAQDNNQSEDWETLVPLYKKLQQDWKKIGHVPRSFANSVWEEFRSACNVFFDNYREKSGESGENWNTNYQQKKELLTQLQNIIKDKDATSKIEEIKNAWNNIGKVPKDKLNIHTDFNKIFKEKLKENNIQEFQLKEEGLSEREITDKARRIKNQIGDIEAEIAKLENNLGFFSNPSPENPLLKDTYAKINQKKEQLEQLKLTLHEMIKG